MDRSGDIQRDRRRTRAASGREAAPTGRQAASSTVAPRDARFGGPVWREGARCPAPAMVVAKLDSATGAESRARCRAGALTRSLIPPARSASAPAKRAAPGYPPLLRKNEKVT